MKYTVRIDRTGTCCNPKENKSRICRIQVSCECVALGGPTSLVLSLVSMFCCFISMEDTLEIKESRQRRRLVISDTVWHID